MLRSPAKIAEAVNRPIDAALTPPQPHRYRIWLSLRWGPDAWRGSSDYPWLDTWGGGLGGGRASGDRPRRARKMGGRGHDALYRPPRFFPCSGGIPPRHLAVGASLIPVVTAGIAIGWLTEWR